MATVITQTANPAGVSASSNVATYSSVSIGTAAPNRTIVVVVGTELAAANPSACTIDGNAMTAGTGGDQGAVQTNLFYLPYPTGTTANIAVTFSAVSPTSTQNHIAVYSVVGGTYSSNGGAQSTDMDSTAPLTTGSITIPTDGGFIAVAAKATDTVRAAWANATEDLDVDAGGFGFTTATRTTALTTTAVTCTGTTNGEDGAMSWIIFGANTAPTVALNSPADAATGVSTTPVLDFTGTDSESNDVRYEVQVSTDSLFPPVAGTNLTSFQDSTDATSYATASITPTANYLVLASVSSSKATTPDTPTLSGNSLTWVQIATNNFDTAGTQRTITLFRAMGSSPTSGALTADFGGNTQLSCTITVDQFSGVDTSGTNGSGAIVQSATNAEASQAAATFTVTLAAFSSSNNATYGTATNGDASNFTVGTGFTSLGASGSATPVVNTFSEWRADNDTTVTFEGSIGYSSGGIAVEIKAATVTIDAVSGTDAGFANPDNGGDTDPFTSGENIQYTVQSALSNSTVYYWRVRAIDPSGSNTYGAWATARSFTTTSGGGTVVKDLIGGGFIAFAR